MVAAAAKGNGLALPQGNCRKGGGLRYDEIKVVSRTFKKISDPKTSMQFLQTSLDRIIEPMNLARI